MKEKREEKSKEKGEGSLRKKEKGGDGGR